MFGGNGANRAARRAGLHAIDHHIDRLAEDIDALDVRGGGGIDGWLEVDLDAVQTNIVYVTTDRPDRSGRCVACRDRCLHHRLDWPLFVS